MSQGKLIKGYTIRVQREGAGWKSEKQYCWAQAGEIPDEWRQVLSDETVRSAEIFLNSQRRFKPGNRKLTAEFSRGPEGQAS